MAILAQVATTKGVIPADQDANGNTIAARDSSGGITVNNVDATNALIDTLNITPSPQTASFTASINGFFPIDATAAAVTVTMLSASANPGLVLYFVKTDSSGHAITLTSVLGTNTTSTQYKILMALSDGTNWYGCLGT